MQLLQRENGGEKGGLVAFKASGQSFMLLLHSADAQGFKEIGAFWLFPVSGASCHSSRVEQCLSLP